MNKVIGNIWDIQAAVKVIPTNGMHSTVTHLVYKAHMGAGLAKQAADRWGVLPYLLGDALHQDGNKIYIFQVPPAFREDLRCTTIVTFPTKHDWGGPSSLFLIEESARELRYARIQNRWPLVVLPRVGCGLGGLDWAVVEPILEQYLDHHFTVVGAP